MNQINTEAQKYLDAAIRYENLSYSLSSTDGQVVIKEIQLIKESVQRTLNQVATKVIPFPYEYSKEELQQQKQLRAQVEVMAEVLDRLNAEKCMQIAQDYKEKASKLQAGVPINAAY